MRTDLLLDYFLGQVGTDQVFYPILRLRAYDMEREKGVGEQENSFAWWEGETQPL